MFNTRSDFENPGIYRKIALAIKASRSGMTVHQVVERLEESDVYATKSLVGSILSQMVKDGRMTKEDYVPCKGCGRKLATYKITEKGLVSL